MRVVLADVERGALERATNERGAWCGGAGRGDDVSKPEQVDALAAETLRHFGAVHVV